MKSSGIFLKNEVFWETVLEWFDDLASNRGNRAELRRAKTPFEVYVSSAFQRDFRQRLRQKGILLSEEEAERLAPGIGVLAHAKNLLQEGHFAKQLATTDKGSQEVRDVRFRKLLAVEKRDELFTMLVRLTKYLDSKVDPKSLIQGAFWWNDTTRKNWAATYYTPA